MSHLLIIYGCTTGLKYEHSVYIQVLVIVLSCSFPFLPLYLPHLPLYPSPSLSSFSAPAAAAAPEPEWRVPSPPCTDKRQKAWFACWTLPPFSIRPLMLGCSGGGGGGLRRKRGLDWDYNLGLTQWRRVGRGGGEEEKEKEEEEDGGWNGWGWVKAGAEASTGRLIFPEYQSGKKSDTGMPHFNLYMHEHACLCVRVSLWWHMWAGVAFAWRKSGE